jgi:hypothetical protein
MFVLGHVGFGRAIIGSRGRALPLVPLVVGIMLPDIIDKPLYYLHLSPFISCTRTFGHTGLFLLLLVTIALIQHRRSPGPSGAGTRARVWIALAAGAATHGVMDGFLDMFSSGRSSTLIAFAWPFLDTHFFSYPFKTPLDQLWQILKAPVLICEFIGGLLLWREYRARRT